MRSILSRWDKLTATAAGLAGACSLLFCALFVTGAVAALVRNVPDTIPDFTTFTWQAIFWSAMIFLVFWNNRESSAARETVRSAKRELSALAKSQRVRRTAWTAGLAFVVVVAFFLPEIPRPIRLDDKSNVTVESTKAATGTVDQSLGSEKNGKFTVSLNADLDRAITTSGVHEKLKIAIERPQPIPDPSASRLIESLGYLSHAPTYYDSFVDGMAIAGGLNGSPFRSDGREIKLKFSSILFDHNSYALSGTAVSQLESIAAFCREVDGDFLSIKRVVVFGHSDNTGPAGDNVEVSRLRAESVGRFLARTIDPNLFFIVPQGEYFPIESNETPAGRRCNRRVEIEVEIGPSPRPPRIHALSLR